MTSYKITLEAFTGAKTTTWVIAKNFDSAKCIAENRVNKKSPNGWKAIDIVPDVKPDGVRDN